MKDEKYSIAERMLSRIYQMSVSSIPRSYEVTPRGTTNQRFVDVPRNLWFLGTYRSYLTSSQAFLLTRTKIELNHLHSLYREDIDNWIKKMASYGAYNVEIPLQESIDNNTVHLLRKTLEEDGYRVNHGYFQGQRTLRIDWNPPVEKEPKEPEELSLQEEWEGQFNESPFTRRE
jgi:hypothetical protein